jgi:electron transfer flavoprotein alpha subunit
MENQRILIYAELNGGRVESSYFELLSKAGELFPSGGAEVAAVILGSGTENAIGELSGSGADFVYGMDDEKLRLFHIDYYAEAVLQAVKEFDADILLIPASSYGEELAPTLGVKLKTGVAAHCMDITVADDGQFIQMVPAFGGKVICEIFTPNTRPRIASVKPGMFPAIRQPAR